MTRLEQEIEHLRISNEFHAIVFLDITIKEIVNRKLDADSGYYRIRRGYGLPK